MAIGTAAMMMIELTTTAKTASLVRITVNNDAGAAVDPATGVSVIAIGLQ